jgi:hypothetical protein
LFSTIIGSGSETDSVTVFVFCFDVVFFFVALAVFVADADARAPVARLAVAPLASPEKAKIQIAPMTDVALQIL